MDVGTYTVVGGVNRCVIEVARGRSQVGDADGVLFIAAAGRGGACVGCGDCGGARLDSLLRGLPEFV